MMSMKLDQMVTTSATDVSWSGFGSNKMLNTNQNDRMTIIHDCIGVP